MPAVLILTLFFFLVVFFLSLPLVSFLFLGVSFSNSYFLVMVPVVALFFVHGKVLFFSACRDRILLF